MPKPPMTSQDIKDLQRAHEEVKPAEAYMQQAFIEQKPTANWIMQLSNGPKNAESGVQWARNSLSVGPLASASRKKNPSRYFYS
jgi:hypothetical protein